MDAAKEVLLGRLWWSPEGQACHTPETEGSKVVRMQELSDFQYVIPHYPPEIVGRAFGPLGLDRILMFCSELQKLMDQNSKVVLSYPQKDDSEMRTNAAVLVGAYLVLWCGWSSMEVGNALGQAPALLTFPCAWAKCKPTQSEQILRVTYCWQALEEAVKHNWLDPTKFKDPDTLAQMIIEFRRMAFQFDGSWIVPGVIFVCADPVSTGLDPNPVTFTRLFPPIGIDEESNSDYTSQNVTALGVTVVEEVEDSPWSLAPSVDSVCKPYVSTDDDKVYGKPIDFTSFLKELGVGLLVRTNRGTEPGLERSYQAEDFTTRGIDHLHMPCDDVRGSVPGDPEFNTLLGRCKSFLDGSKGAIAIHCKGGFGRSVCCAAKLVSVAYDIPGTALLGWIRISRPGALNTSNQELFISSLNRSMDIDEIVAPKNLPKCGCSVQ